MRKTAAAAFAAAVAAVLVGQSSASSQKPAPLQFESGDMFGQSNHILERENAYYWQPDGSRRIDMSHGYLVDSYPTCVWDINEHVDGRTNGYMNPGYTTTRSDCKMAGISRQPECYYIGNPSGDDWCYVWSGSTHWYGYSILSSAPTLSTQVCYSPGRCFTDDTAVWNAGQRLWEYRGCIQSDYDYTDPALYIPAGTLKDENGNDTTVIPYGSFPYTLQESVSLSVTNTGTRQVKQVYAFYGFSSDIFFPQGCVPWGYTFTDPSTGRNPNDSSVPKQTDYPFRWVVQ